MKRILRKTLRFFGYDLKKYGAHYLVPLVPIDQTPSPITPVTQAFDGEGFPQIKESSDFLESMVVYLRTCLRDNRNRDQTPRFHGSSLTEGTYRCIRSLVACVNEASIKYPDRCLRVIILDDRSEDGALENLKSICSQIICPWEIRTTQITGQGESLYEQFTDARGQSALCYFVEDDFLHERSAIWEMWDFYRQIYRMTGKHLMIHPQDGLEMYGATPGGVFYPSYLVLSEHRRWRTINNATHVLLTSGVVVNEYWQYIKNTRYVGHRKKRRLGAESRTTNLIFNHIPGFAPIPALAIHLQFPQTIPPFFSWQPLWAQYGEKR